MSRPKRSVPNRKNSPFTAGQTRWKFISIMPQNRYSSPEQKKRSFCTFFGSSVYSRLRFSMLRR